ncbi:MAG: N-acetylmuramoyl-L-alanine amidase [Tissierellia bacterium]|nr:N-acetylmuramoyl-L-alanine amidase [Tissierellia bacterium]
MKRKNRIYILYLNKKILFILTLLLLIIIGIIFTKGSRALNIFSYRDGQVIVIDPGHGGIDGGAGNVKDVLEKDINLDVGIKLKKQLLVEGFNVVMTREVDQSLEHLSSLNASRYRRDLDARKNIIDNNEPVVFISIHVNSSKKSTARGAKIYHYPNSTEGKRLADSIARSIDANLYEKFLKEESLRTEVLSEDYYILREPSYTGVLVEIGFITNPEEKRLLMDEDYKERLAFAIKKGILEYLD